MKPTISCNWLHQFKTAHSLIKSFTSCPCIGTIDKTSFLNIIFRGIVNHLLAPWPFCTFFQPHLELIYCDNSGWLINFVNIFKMPVYGVHWNLLKQIFKPPITLSSRIPKSLKCVSALHPRVSWLPWGAHVP